MIFGSVAFSAPMATDTLGIYLSVAPVHEIKVLKSIPENVGAFNKASSRVTHTFTESAQSVSKYFMVIKTNNKQAVHIDVFVKNMKSTGIASQISYTVSTETKTVSTGTNTVSTETKTVVSTASGISETLFTETTPWASRGMRIVSSAFTITLSSTDVAEATAASYVANIVFSLVSP